MSQEPQKTPDILKVQQDVEREFWLRFFPRSWVKNTVERITPEGLIASWTISTAAGIVLPIDLAVSVFAHFIGWDNPIVVVLKISAILGLGLIGALNIVRESRAYKEKKFSASPFGTVMYAGTGKAKLSAFVQIFQDHIQLSFSNPWVIAGVAHQDIHALIDGYLGISPTVVIWYLFWNTLILNGHLDPWLEKVKPLTNKIDQIRIFLFKSVKTYSNPT